MKRLSILILAALPLMASAQGDDFGLDFSLEAQKKLSKQWSLSLEGELRTRDNTKTNDRWSAGLGVDYKVAKWLKLSAGYNFLYDNNERDKTTEGVTSKKGYPKVKHTYAQYWGPRHRFNVSLTASQNIGDFKLSLRERWQYTYRPEKTVTRTYERTEYDFSGNVREYTEGEEEHTYSGKAKNVLRSRLQLSYDKKGLAVSPYASAELFNAWSLQKTRYTVGLDWKLSKQHSLGAFYRYQNVRNDDFDNEPNRHLIGVGYKFKF